MTNGEMAHTNGKRKRILTTYTRTWYGRGVSDSNEWGFFSSGLFASMGWDEYFVPYETALDPAVQDAARQAGPYDAVFTMPFERIETWLRPLVGPSTPIIVWMPDDTWRFDFSRQWIEAGVADHIITTEGAALERYRSIGIDRDVLITLSSFGCRPDLWPRLVGPPPPATPTAGFCGFLHGARGASLQAIADAGPIPIDVHSVTESRPLPLADYHRHLASHAFALCLTASSHGPPQMKARLFEPQLYGTILLTEPVPRLHEYWTPCVDCIVFHSPAEAQSHMKALLDDPDLMEAIADAAYARVIREHPYQMRFAEVFNAMGLPYQMPDFSAAVDEDAPEVDPSMDELPAGEPS